MITFSDSISYFAGIVHSGASAAAPLVKTPAGPIRGQYETVLGSTIAAFRGIPYAQPPVGPGGRWAPPREMVCLISIHAHELPVLIHSDSLFCIIRHQLHCASCPLYSRGGAQSSAMKTSCFHYCPLLRHVNVFVCVCVVCLCVRLYPAVAVDGRVQRHTGWCEVHPNGY